MRPTSALAALALTACQLEEAPPTLDAVYEAFWNDFDADDEVLQGHVRDALEVLDLEELEKGTRGEQQRLGPEDVAGLDFDGEVPDPSAARPMYYNDLLPCTLEDYEAILTHDDQNEIYGVYEDYERTYLLDKADFLAGRADELQWRGRIVTEFWFFATYRYVYEFFTEARRVPLPDDLGVPGSHALIVRNWMVAPGTFEEGDGAFDQDYQLEVLWPRSEDELVHIYPVWREMRVGTNTMEDDTMANVNIGQTVKWNQTTGRTCRDGLP